MYKRNGYIVYFYIFSIEKVTITYLDIFQLKNYKGNGNIAYLDIFLNKNTEKKWK